VRRASIEVDTTVPTLESRPATGVVSAIPKALLPVWQRHQETNRERAEALAQFCEQENPDEDWLEAGRRAAHQLAGSLGTFGLQQASLLARDVENLITHFATLGEEQRARLERVVHALQLQIADPQLRLPDVDQEAPQGSLLIFSIDAEWSGQLAQEAREAGFSPLLTDDPAGVRRVFALEQPEKLILDLTELGQEGLSLIHDMSGPGRKVVAVLEPGQNRRAFSCPCLEKPFSLQAALDLMQSDQSVAAAARKVLAVDDDVIVLETLEALLRALNIELHTLSDPLHFWETLATVKPDLVMLDVDLPYVGGVELCRALRAEPRYFDMPVIFLSAYNDSETVHRVFSAGADDYVFKPIIGPELLTRTRNRLMRARVQDSGEEVRVAHSDGRPDVSMMISDEAISRELFTQLSQKGLKVERLTQSGAPLIEHLTCSVDQRPRLVLLDVLASNDVLQNFEGLGINNYSQVWVRGDLSGEDIQLVYEWGLAGYLPESLPVEALVRKLERALAS